jgi:hypothetical protein
LRERNRHVLRAALHVLSRIHVLPSLNSSMFLDFRQSGAVYQIAAYLY